jgi:hypothetical protein
MKDIDYIKRKNILLHSIFSFRFLTFLNNITEFAEQLLRILHLNFLLYDCKTTLCVRVYTLPTFRTKVLKYLYQASCFLIWRAEFGNVQG